MSPSLFLLAFIWTPSCVHTQGEGKPDLTRTAVQPRDAVFHAGSTATFSCVPPAGERVERMYVRSDRAGTGRSGRSGRSGEQPFTLTAQLDQPSDVCVEVKCKTNRRTYGACAYVGYPPADRDLQCGTSDMKSVECTWTVGRATHLSLPSPTQYHLLGRPCFNGTVGRCSQSFSVEAGVRNWTLTAENILGAVELYDEADLTRRVHMLAPGDVAASWVGPRGVGLKWMWRVQQYFGLSLICQVHVSHEDTTSISEHGGVGLRSAAVHGLTPSWTYEGKVRCGTAEPFWKWGDWSQSVVFSTLSDVPDDLDVWRQQRDNSTLIMWRFVQSSQTHGDILDYEVSWTKTGATGQANRTTVAPGHHSVPLRLDPWEEHTVTVTARNANGSSSPSSITIPAISHGGAEGNVSWITGRNRTFSLSWPESPAASRGYIVEWFPTFGEEDLEWLRVPSNETNSTFYSSSFKDGLRYSLSVYACGRGSPALLQRWEGYVQEKGMEDDLFKPLHFKQRGLDVKIFWDSFSLRNQSAFIQGYVLSYKELNGQLFRVETDDPHSTSLTATNLRVTTYTFTVTAITSVGECGSTSIMVMLNSQTDDLLVHVLVSLLCLVGLMSLALVFCYSQWARIKQKVYPPIPKPVLSEKWLLSLGQPRGHCRLLDHSLYSEADTRDTALLHYLHGALVTADVAQKDVHPFGSDYHSRSLQPYILLPSGLCSTVFPNPSYDLIIPTETHGARPGLHDQGETTAMEMTHDYQPQSLSALKQKDEDSAAFMPCVPSYIPLPTAS